ncbi:terminase [Campylobacter pinnipediorum subsp. pinnipediorum]|uniref:Terminase n=1 Tax=Campylobacter pinnipediorum subsp. pinnipediorum TaxID=1660067 RepID=A0AAX0L9F5_9BACT|nr:terminase gpA endonuclease subunit [Campylobacter pinnipediorum]OPA77264.1 terminase [Campylobacter pinnipediorum subsp. pinnipediorum]
MRKIISIFANSIFIKPRLNLTDWAKEFRILSRESSSNYGRFKPFSYQIEPMNEISNQKRRKVVLLWASQLGKSEMINNTIGYYIHQEPSTVLFMLPNENDAEDYSKRRLTPMIRDCKEINALINSNDSNNTILIKNFRGGNLALVGSNSPSKLASKPIKVLLVDEADRCEATKEGDSIKLAEKRTITFADRKIIISSTPTIKGSSAIEAEFESSDKRFFYVTCPHCGFKQTLKFEYLVWDKDDKEKPLYDTAKYQCAECGSLLSEQEKNEAVRNGERIAKNPHSKTAGFFLNAIYSPFFKMSDIARDWYESKNDQLKLQTFINTIKCESFEPPAVKFNENELYNRRETYTANNFPVQVEFITAGVDIQDNRIEINFIGWARGLEAYNIEYIQCWGNTDQDKVWMEAYKEIVKKFKREDNKTFIVSLVCIDSGFNAERVYRLVSLDKRFIATKGLSEQSSKASFLNKLKNIQKGVKFMPVGTYAGKNKLYRLLSITEPGDGYFHYNESYTQEFFNQLTAEKIEKVKDKNGYTKLRWVKTRERNEALDITLLAYAAAKLLKISKRKKKSSK